jgi:hypothetical protein
MSGAFSFGAGRKSDDTSVIDFKTASPSMMQELERRRANVSTIRGKRYVRSLPERL